MHMKKSKLEQLLTETHRDAFLWARQCCRFDEERAKDVLQTVYLKVWDGQARYKGDAAFKTWLFSVIRFTALEHLRGEKLMHILPDELPMEEMEVHKDQDCEQLLLKLPQRQREVLLLVFYHQHTLAEVADILAIGLGSVRTHYQRGKDKLKDLLTKEVRHE